MDADGIGEGYLIELAKLVFDRLSVKFDRELLEVGVELGWVPLLCLLILLAWSARTLILILKAECGWTTCLLAMIVVMSGINAMVTGDINDNRMFFALILVPFLYRPTQVAIPGLERSRGARRGLHLATPQ